MTLSKQENFAEQKEKTQTILQCLYDKQKEKVQNILQRLYDKRIEAEVQDLIDNREGITIPDILTLAKQLGVEVKQK